MAKSKKKKYVGNLVPSEHDEQVILFRKLEELLIAKPILGLVYAIPNGTRTTIRIARKMKAEGVKSGIPDIHFPVARDGYLSLYVEMKARPYINDDGKTVKQTLSPTQRACKTALERMGNKVAVCEGWNQALGEILHYEAAANTIIVAKGGDH